VIEVARSLQTSPAVEDVLGAVVDAALALTGAERGFVLLKSGDALTLKVGLDNRGSTLTAFDLNVPSNLLFRSLNERRELLFMNLSQRDLEEIGETEFRNVTCVPLVQFRSLNTQQTLAVHSQNDTVGVIYLDSKTEQTPLSELNRELLHTLALEASTVLENAKLLEEERQKLLLERELSIAREIQQSLLPSGLPSEGWFRAAGSNLPSAKVSGDYFDVRPVGKDAWAVVVADVSGKGVSSALLASLLQGAFLLASELSISLGELMSKINSFLTERARGEKYATLFYATIFRSGEMIWANAGHCSPFLVRKSGQIESLAPTGPPLGLVPGAAFEVKSTRLSPGDKIAAYSDGLTEAENALSETFDSKLRPALAAALELGAQEIHDLLVRAVRLFAAGSTPQDDVTLLVIEYRGD
jgi:phosphoserine phosphatase RsbU/P